MTEKCAVRGCKRSVRSKGFCAPDYQKLRMLTRTHRLPEDWKLVSRGAATSCEPVVLPRGRAGTLALKAARAVLEKAKAETADRAWTFRVATKVEKRATAPQSDLRRFVLNREFDPTGTSGVGIVAEGVQFSNGQVVIHWLSQLEAINVYANAIVLEKLHGHGGNTAIEWLDT